MAVHLSQSLPFTHGAQSRLTINAEGAASEEAFIMSNYGEDGLCTDASFAPGPSSL
jgi:hypothetical protein